MSRNIRSAGAEGTPGKPKLLTQVRAKCRLLHYSKPTEEAYVGWIVKFIVFYGKRHPEE